LIRVRAVWGYCSGITKTRLRAVVNQVLSDRAPRVHAFPSSDREFLDSAQRAVAESWALIGQSRALLAEVEAKLRTRYPAAAVRQREEMALLDERDLIVYAFRDGHAA
jgi:hypothetical protein